MLDKIKAEIKKVLDRERDFTTESTKAQALALFWVLELFDKYAEQDPCDDVVSRHAVIKLVRRCNSALEEPRIFNSHNSGVVFEQYINELPSVTQKPIECNDVVSRQAVLKMAYDMSEIDGEHFTEPCMVVDVEDIQKLPSVIPQEPKWIPVSERLPEDGTYLVTLERIVGEPRIDIKSFAKDLHKVDEFDFSKHKCGWYDYDSECGYWEDTKVIAWMPLPKPYEQRESEG